MASSCKTSSPKALAGENQSKDVDRPLSFAYLPATSFSKTSKESLKSDDVLSQLMIAPADMNRSDSMGFAVSDTVHGELSSHGVFALASMAVHSDDSHALLQDVIQAISSCPDAQIRKDSFMAFRSMLQLFEVSIHSFDRQLRNLVMPFLEVISCRTNGSCHRSDLGYSYCKSSWRNVHLPR